MKKGEIGLAVGKGGEKIKRFRALTNKQVEIFEFIEDPDKFLRNALKPANVKDIRLYRQDGRAQDRDGDCRPARQGDRNRQERREHKEDHASSPSATSASRTSSSTRPAVSPFFLSCFHHSRRSNSELDGVSSQVSLPCGHFLGYAPECLVEGCRGCPELCPSLTMSPLIASASMLPVLAGHALPRGAALRAPLVALRHLVDAAYRLAAPLVLVSGLPLDARPPPYCSASVLVAWL